MSVDEQEGVYLFFLEIMHDELLFVLSLKDATFTKKYLAQKAKTHSDHEMVLN
jgi:hypothetical protein